MTKSFIIEAKLIFTPTACLEEACVLVDQHGTIEYVGSKSNAPQRDYERISAPDLWLSPGFIDIHNHGGIGIAFGVGDKLAEDLQTYAEWVLKSGVTGFVCSVAGATSDDLNQIIKAYVPILEKGTKGARALGLHLEGPFLNVEKKGAFNPKWLRPPVVEESLQYIRNGGQWIRQISLAPELPHALEVAREFRKAHITVALAHSNSDYETARAALMGDFTHVTHIFNALSEFNHRRPGALGGVLTSDEITGELIADGIHVHPGAMRLLLRTLGSKRISLITDAIPGAGLPDGDYDLIGQKIIVKDGRATLENGTLAGSAALMNQCVRNAHQLADASVQETIRMATYNPAHVIGMQREIGLIASGRSADLILMDQNFDVKFAMVSGEIMFNQI